MPDFRSPRGKRPPRAAILALPWRARRWGSRSAPGIAAGGRNAGARLMGAWGFPRQPPGAAPLPTVLRRVERAEVAATLGAWAEGLLRGPPPLPATTAGLASDGKTWRGRQTQGAPGAPRRSALAPRVGVTRAHQAGAAKTNESPGGRAL
jgi:hypothetical protein